MFNGPLPRPDPKKKIVQRPASEFQDNLLVALQPGHFAHFARQPNSCYKRDKLHYLQRKNDIENRGKQKQGEDIKWNAFKMGFYVRTDRRWLSREIRDRADAKMMEFEAQLAERRDRLRELLAKDEREFNRETVEYFQKGKALKVELIKKKIEERRREQEEEHTKLVNEKRIQQHMERCEEMRDQLSKKHLIESKYIQLQQMRENESRRLSQKEWDGMWEYVMNKKDEAMMNREKQEALERYNKLFEHKDALTAQIKGKEMAKAEMLKQKEEDRQEMNKLAEALQREKLEGLTEERKKKIMTSNELKKQMKMQQKIRDDRSKADADWLNAFDYLSQLEYQKELKQEKTSSEVYRKEVDQFRRNLVDIKSQRKLEDMKLQEILDADKKQIEQKQDDLRCKQQMAQQKLLQDVLKQRGEQLLYKKEEAERERERKQAEDELLGLAMQSEKELEKAYHRRKQEENQQRLEDWQKHIGYNKALEERKKAEAERLLEIARQEEEKYRKQILESLNSEMGNDHKHPFRNVLEQYECYCKK